jgi:hypothetical protein
LSLTFLSPLGALAALAVLVPAALLVLRERRHARVREALALGPPPLRLAAPSLVAFAVAFGLLGGAAAQPVVRMQGTAEQRADAEAFVVVDITRSMLAAGSPDEPRRIDRALEAAIEIRRALPDLPVGVASLTNRPLPHLFPGTDQGQFELVVRQAIGVNRPPPTTKVLFASATDFQTLEAMATDNFFSPATTKRLVVLLTDGESSDYPVRIFVRGLQKGGVDLVVVRFWDQAERVWRADGSPEPGYRPRPETYARLSDLAALTTGGRVYDESDLTGATAAARAYLGEGPVVSVRAPGHTVSLAPYAVLAACLPLAGLLLSGFSAARLLHPRRFAYSMVVAWRASWRPAARRSRGTPAPSPPTSSVPRSSMGGSSPAGD